MHHHSETTTNQPLCPKPRRVCPSLPDFLKPLSSSLRSSNWLYIDSPMHAFRYISWNFIMICPDMFVPQSVNKVRREEAAFST
ncbi:hypothetical protein YC2023_010120 [Brassica napus]